MTVHSRSSSPAPSAAEPAAKRPKLDQDDLQQQPSAKCYAFVPAYDRGLHLAPMVRCGTLPTRLLSLQFGANLVWGPEIVDRALIGAERLVDPSTGVVSFVNKGKSVWETHPVEKPRLIFQIGSASPELAVSAAKLVQNDVAGVDLNCGCPKPFSTSGAMGAMLLYAPDTLCAILRALVEALDVPVSCKIRLLPTQEDTLKLVDQISKTGISNLTVHCRTKDMRPREPALVDRLRDIVELMKPTGIPVVANGDCLGFLDADRVRDLTGVSACMIARAAEANPSCFDVDGPRDPITEILPLYARVAHAVGNHYSNAKYCLNCMDLAASPLKGSTGMPKRRKQMKQEINTAKGYDQLAKAFKTDLLSEEQRKDWINLLLPDLKSLTPHPSVQEAEQQANEHQPPV